MYYPAGLLLLINIFLAWRYSKTTADPDWAYFNLWGFTGSVYGRDFADCKTPVIHLWYLLLSKIVGKSVASVKFVNHFLVGIVGLAFLPNFEAALAYTVLVNSGWLLAFHGNVGQLPAALIGLSFVTEYDFVLWVLALLIEPKLILSFLVVVVINGWWLSFLLVIPLAIVYLLRKKDMFGWIWESSVTIPERIAKGRKADFYKVFMPWFTSNSTLYLLPWVVFAVLAKPNLLYWLPVIVYIILIVFGKVIRQNHFIPIIPFIAFSGMENVWVLALVDFTSAGFYFGNIWARFYQALDDLNNDAKSIGIFLKDKEGSLYVNGIHSGIYIYSEKPVSFGFAEQIEIREVAKERRKRMVEQWRENPPKFVVDGEMRGIVFKPIGYRKIAEVGQNVIYQR